MSDTITVNIYHHSSHAILFAAVLSSGPYSDAENLGRAVKLAVLEGANLRYANLRYANLQSADLQSANLQSANLQGADLRYADLRYANLRCADLRYADLRYANLRCADLQGANLQGANLQGAKVETGFEIKLAPVFIYGLTWSITLWDEHLRIGCQLHPLNKWARFQDATIAKMDTKALEFWKAHKSLILGLAEANGRVLTKPETPDEE